MIARGGPVVGRLLLLACVVFVVVGGQLWSLTSEVSTTERVYASCPAPVPVKDCGFTYQRLLTGSKPNRTPALLAFAAGGAAGLCGVVLVRSRSARATRRELLVPN